MSNVWIGKQIRPELDVLAFAESQESGHTVTRSKLARGIFAWAFEQYKKAGSLRRLKSARLVFPEESQPISEDDLWDRIGARGQK